MENKSDEVVEIKTLQMKDFPDEYKLLQDAYYGSGGFKDGNYLFPHVRETIGKYNRRKLASYYTNYLSPIVKGIVAPIFRNEAKREWATDDKLFSDFMEDVDKGRRSMKKFIKKAATMAKRDGVVFIVVDNVDEVPATLGEAKDTRAFPYAYTVLPKHVREYEVTKNGILKMIKFDIHSIHSSNGVKSQVTETWTWTDTKWRKEGGDLTEPIEKEHSLGCVPVVPLFGTENEDGELIPQSECLQMAKVNLAIFNVCSELRELLRNQCFSVLAYPFTEKLSADQLKEMIVGTEDMLPFDGDAGQPPVYINPAADSANTLQAELERLITEMYRMASMASVTGVQQETSGVAKAWDFEQTNQTISDLADNCEDAEKQIALLFGLWQGIEVGYECKYPDDFGIIDIKAELDEITEALALNVGGKFNEQLKKKATALMFQDLNEDNYNAIIADIEQETEFEVQTRAFEAQAEQATLQETIKNPGGTPPAG